MLNQYLIKKLAVDLQIAPLNIVREYLEMEVLYYLSQSILSKNLIFYGGTALRLGYHSLRFSEDLDFLLIKKLKSDKDELRNVLELVAKNNSGVSVEEIFEKRWTLFGLLHIKNELLKHPIRIKIEISKKKNGIKKENILISSNVSNKEIIFRVAKLDSLYHLKEQAIKNRNMPRDWFDYWYISQKLQKVNELDKIFPFSKNEFVNELKRWLSKNQWGIIETIINFFQLK